MQRSLHKPCKFWSYQILFLPLRNSLSTVWSLLAAYSGVITWCAARFFIGGERGEWSAFLLGKVAGNKISFNLSSLGPGEVVANSNDSDWSWKRCLALSLNDDGDDELKGFSRRGRFAFSLNGDVDDELEDFSRIGKSSNDSHPDGGFEESFNLLLSSIGGEVGVPRCLLLEAAGVMKDSVGNADDVILGLAGKINITDLSLSLISVNILEFRSLCLFLWTESEGFTGTKTVSFKRLKFWLAWRYSIAYV